MLDVGTKDGQIALQLSKLGLQVDAIDTEPLPNVIPDITFNQVSVEDFLASNSKTYDIVVARHVLPFTKDPLSLIQQLNSIAGIFVFTCFGQQDDWRDADHIVTLDKAELYELFKRETIKHYSETFEETRGYQGNLKFWHYHTFVIDNRT